MAQPETSSAPRATLPAALRLGPVHLTVRDLDRSVEWYERSLGLQPMGDGALGDGTKPTERVGEGLRMGHMHLHVGDVDEALAFYRDVLGFDLQANLGTAAFVSAGGYHHHVGFNVWKGQGIGPQPPQTIGLDHWT